MVFIEHAGNHALLALIKHYNHHNTMQTLVHHLSQAERLALCDGRTIIDAATLGTPPAIHPTTGQPVFVPTWERTGTPSRAYVGVRPSVIVSHGEEEEEEQGEEEELRDIVAYARRESLREHSFRLPSQSSRADVRETLKSMGCTFND